MSFLAGDPIDELLESHEIARGKIVLHGRSACRLPLEKTNRVRTLKLKLERLLSDVPFELQSSVRNRRDVRPARLADVELPHQGLGGRQDILSDRRGIASIPTRWE